MIVDTRTIKKFAWIPRTVECERIWFKYYSVVQELRPRYIECWLENRFTRVYTWYDVSEQLL